MDDKAKYQLKKLRLERELMDKAAKLALVIGTIFLAAIVAWRLL